MKEFEFTSPYTPNTETDRRTMLDAIGVSSLNELFKDIPKEFNNPKLSIPPPTSELELRREFEAMARTNLIPGDYSCFLGGGSYRHHIPAVVRQLAARSEFMTSYTPYQPEVSQGTLQAHYEFQTMVCQLTGMDVANSGMYDGATAMAEGALMAVRLTKKRDVAVLNTVSPAYVEVLKTYLQAPDLSIRTIVPGENLNDDIACLIVQQPNYMGYIEDIEALTTQAHKNNSLVLSVVDPVSLGLFKPPGDYDADIVVAEGQGMGVSPTFGGPYVGFFACKQEYIRQMPGRIVGKTVDRDGRTGYVLTMQTREQHIRRERATSNICTSVGLIALMSTIYMASMGRRGIRHIAETCYHKAHYLASLIDQIKNYTIPITGTFFREFVIKCPRSPIEINERLLDHKIIGGIDVSNQVPNGMLLCCTEINTREEIEALAKALQEIGN